MNAKIPLIQRAALLLLLSILTPQLSTAFAQGTAFTYRGQLNDGPGSANGVYDLTFTLFGVSNGGSAVAGPRTNTATSVTNGLFTITLDFGAGAFPGADRWLDISVRTNGTGAFTLLSPRQQITSTPYAIQSANAGTATSVSGSVSASQLTGTISSNNIGSGTITAPMLAAGSVTTASLADGAVTLAKLNTVSNWLLTTTFANPTPADSDSFGISVAAVGSDKVLIGAYQDDTSATNAGAAYLFSADGLLLTTFTNPTPAVGDFFGWSVAAVGSDKVLIGAYQDDTGATAAGAAYLFSTSGALLTTFTNPTPATSDQFGYSVAALGSDKVLIGAYLDNTGATDAGAAYLFSTNGTLLTTFTNPTPAFPDYFGISVTAVGLDKVLIGASRDDTGATDAGAAYLFSTNGTLLTIFINPTPVGADQFGRSVAAVGSDKVLIGAYQDDAGAGNAGAAYLFSTSGALLTTFTNPTPAVGDIFGWSVAAVGSDKVLIGAQGDDTGAGNAGAAYLFSTNGTLLTTFTKPTPAADDFFGFSVAAVGSDRVLIGAYRDDTGATDAGAAYLFSLSAPYIPGLISQGVTDGSITAASLQDGAVTATKIGTISAANIADGTISSEMLAAGAVGSNQLADGAVTAAKVATVSNWFALTITNRTPAADDQFGISVAALGNDRVLIGAPRAGVFGGGAAYLFSANGALLTDFEFFPADVGDAFGYSVAAVGTDRVLIGARGDNTGASFAGAAYLFNTNGVRLITITNPAPAAGDDFGRSVAAVGTDRVLIGAFADDTGATNAGAAYLFGTNGTLLTTFTNPAPALNDFFGNAVAAVGTDRVLIGAYQDDTNRGAAYLFSTNGVLLTTFTNPTPAVGFFGQSVAAMGTDRVLIGAIAAAYLFRTNGGLLTTFTNPTTAAGQFGISVAAVGTDRVLIGADRDVVGFNNVGAAYLFSTNGALLTTFTNPTPADGDEFAHSVAAVGTGRVVIGAHLDDTSASDAGAAYLFGFQTYTPGLIADGVSAGAITVVNLDPTIGVWTRSGDNVFRREGNVGIGTDTPRFTLEVNGTAGKPGGGSWSSASDARLKKNIRPLAGALDKLLALRGVNFEYIDPAKIHELSGERMGLLAQEVEKVFPDWVETGQDGYKRLTVRGVEALVVEALRELQQKQETKLAEELKRRDAENAELKSRLTVLEKVITKLAEKGN